MRIQLKLKALQEKEFPYNYNFRLFEEVFNLFQLGSSDFINYLQKIGYKQAGKPFKFFTFALHFENVLRRGNKLVLRSNNAHLIVSFPPILNEYIGSFSDDKLTDREIKISATQPSAVLNVRNIELVPEPEFSDMMRFVPLTPLVVSARKEIKGKPITKFYTFTDHVMEVNRLITEGLNHKYNQIYNKDAPPEGVKIFWDRAFIEEKLNEKKRITAQFSLDMGRKKTTVKGSMIPFAVRGNKELIKLGYQCGFGHMNSLGFGLVDVSQ